jgi:hypothetical protein
MRTGRDGLGPDVLAIAEDKYYPRDLTTENAAMGCTKCRRAMIRLGIERNHIVWWCEWCHKVFRNLEELI